MGCDIHLCLEKKHDGVWVGINSFSWEVLSALSAPLHSVHFPARERHYDLFAALAGVRGDGPEAKGLPEDMSSLTMMLTDEIGGNGHSRTWYSLKEAAEIYELVCDGPQAAQRVAGKLLNEKTTPAMTKYFGIQAEYFDDPKEIDNYRVVFWFDN